VTTYVHYQDHVYWGTATFYENKIYEVPGATYLLARACKRPKLEVPQEYFRRRLTVQEVLQEEGVFESFWHYPEQSIHQPVSTFSESVRIPVRNTQYIVCSSNVRQELSRTSRLVVGWLLRVEWDHFRFYPSTTTATGLRSILEEERYI
jgi:hypothetical protein